MIQILGFWSSIEFGIINGIYSLVIKVYNIMEKILEQDVMDMSKFESIATTMYVLAGVFILFKVVIAMVQMILNPDLVTDKQAGAGKLITRIVTCLVMLIAFSPNGFIFGYEGLFSRIEKAVIAPDGLINNIINADLSTADKKETEISNQSYNNNSNGGFFIENVYAATNVNCYYYRISSSEYNTEDADAHGNERKKIKVDKIYKISYYYNPSKTTISTERLKRAGDSKNVYYKERSGIIGGSANCTSGNCAEYSHLAYPIKMAKVSNVESRIKDGKCPGSLEWDKNDKTWKARSYGATSVSPGLRGGTSTLKDIQDKIKTLSTSVAGFDSGGNSFVDKSNGRSKPTGDDYLFFTPVSENAVAFGQATASSLQECAPSAQSDCIKYQKDMFETKSANKEIVNLIDDENLEVSFIFSIITGIGLIIYLLFLCVEIIIRRLKLFFLEVLAPIPIISYVDPKDKTFNTWFKMYISTYLDLFIKLIAIKIAIDLVATISNEFWSTGNIDTGIIGGTLIKFFYIVAILAFAKILPTMVSKIFNLDSMGGSFKDIMGMAKGATGFGAGAVLGGAAGFASGKGLGRISGFAKGTLMGAGSGGKGNITGGAKAISAKNAKINEAAANGLNFWQRTAASAAGAIGYSPKTRMDNKIKEKVDSKQMLDNFRKHKDNIENMADSSNYLSDLKTKMANGEISKEQFKAARSRFIELNEKGRKNEAGYYEIQHSDGSWHVANIGVEGLDEGPIKFEKSAQGKIAQAEAEMRAEFLSNRSLQKELGMEGQNISNFKEFEGAESKAREKSNQYSTEIITVQSSDKYGKAQAFDDYSKGK